MALAVVQVLEVVQVDEQQCAKQTLAGAGGQAVFQAVFHQAAVGQACEGIVKRQALQFVFGLLTPGDITLQFAVGLLQLQHLVFELADERFAVGFKQRFHVFAGLCRCGGTGPDVAGGHFQ